MLFQPTNVIPSSLTGPGAGVVDVTQDMDVSWQVNGNSPMVAYQIKIMQNTAASTVLINTGKVTLSSPFYGMDTNGNYVRFSRAITATQMGNAGMTNGYVYGYKLLITQWWDSTHSIEQSSASYFAARTTPVLTINDNLSTPITSHTHKFTAYYYQAQGVGTRWFRWQIMSRTNAGQIIKDTGKVFGSSEIAVTFDGFINNEIYAIRCMAATEDDLEISTQWTAFSVQYEKYTFTGGFIPITACSDCTNAAVRVQVAKNLYCKGISSGTYSLITSPFASILTNLKTLVLPSVHDAVTWGGAQSTYLDISNPCGFAISGEFTSIDIIKTPLIEFLTDTGAYMIMRDGNGVYFQHNEDIIHEYSVPIANNTAFRIAVSKEYFGIKVGSNDAVIDSILPWQEETINTIVVYGSNYIDYITVIRDGWDYDEIMPILTTLMIPCAPVHTHIDNRTEFFVAFNGSLVAGYLAFGGLGPRDAYGYTIYRRTDDEDKLIKIIEYPVSNEIIYDYGVSVGHSYEYFLYLEMSFQGTITTLALTPGTSAVSPTTWNYHLICCDVDSQGNNIVRNQYTFALDINSGSMSNNNSPTTFQSFTRFPVFQRVSSNYRSGTLSVYIGKVENDNYVDSAALMEELYALSTSNCTKFLKTRKGELFQVEIASPMTMQIGDKFAAQPAKVSLPWVQVGDATDARIIGTKGRIELPYFYIDPQSMSLIMTYPPMYISSTAFSLSNADLYINDPGEYNTNDYYISQSKYLILAPDGDSGE